MEGEKLGDRRLGAKGFGFGILRVRILEGRGFEILGNLGAVGEEPSCWGTKVSGLKCLGLRN